METPKLLEIAAQAVSALLAVWLGLTVATRSGSPAGRSFTLLALVVATWSSSIILQRLTTSEAVRAGGRSIEDIAAALAIGGLAHFALETATHGHPTRRQLSVIAVNYVILMAFALPTILHFELSIDVTPPHFSLGWAGCSGPCGRRTAGRSGGGSSGQRSQPSCWPGPGPASGSCP